MAAVFSRQREEENGYVFPNVEVSSNQEESAEVESLSGEDVREERNRELVNRWIQGYSIVELINGFGLSDSTIQNILTKYGFQVSRSIKLDNTIDKYRNEPREPAVNRELLILKLKSYLSYYEDSISFKYSVKGNHKLELGLPNETAKELFRELRDLGRLVDNNFIIDDSKLILEILI